MSGSFHDLPGLHSTTELQWPTPGQSDRCRADHPALRGDPCRREPTRECVEDLVDINAVLVQNRGRAVVAPPVELAALPLHFAPRQPFAHAA